MPPKSDFLDRMGQAISWLGDILLQAGFRPSEVERNCEDIEELDGKSFRIVVVGNDDEVGSTRSQGWLRTSRAFLSTITMTRAATGAFAALAA